ncbi:MAG: hypothetical protein SFX72_01225 [Isosphaeraceae bacterium]|nr:hypothetical protein [Isosphaeraceae bacterium]
MLALHVGIGPARADVMFGTSQSTGELFRFQVTQVGTPTLDRTLSTNLQLPAGLALSARNELFVTNLGGGPLGSGHVARFLDAAGSLTPNGTIANDQSRPGFSFSRPYDAGFRGDELFVSNFDSKVNRITFDGSGGPVSNGAMTDHLNVNPGTGRGLAISPSGDLFYATGLTSADSGFVQWTFDTAGNSHFAREFSFGIGTGVHDIEFAPWGELFAVDSSASTILRYVFDGAGNPVFNGSITGNGMNVPLGIAFSPWGELFVPSSRAALVSRFVFDPAGNATSNGTFTVPRPLTDILFAPAAVPEPSGLALCGSGLLGLLAVVLRGRCVRLME